MVKRHDGSTRDMAAHLKAVHKIGKEGVIESATVNDTNIVSVTPYPPRSLAKKRCMWALTRWILIGKRPFNFVESKAFKDFCHVLDPKFEVPTRQAVR